MNVPPSQPLWRFTSAPSDGRLLVYRSEDIRNLSRVQQPSVCGYLSSDSAHLLPHGAGGGDGKAAGRRDQEEEGQHDSTPCCRKSQEEVE